MVFTLYTVPLFVAGGLCILVARYVQKHPEAPAARPFIFLMWLGVGWTFIYGLSLMTSWFPLRLFLSIIMYIPTRLIAPVIFWFTLEYTGKDRWLKPSVMVLVFAIPVIAIIASLTSPWHHFFRYDFFLDTSGPFPILRYKAGILFVVSNIYSSTLIFISLILMLLTIRDRSLKPIATMLLIVGIFIPVIVEILFTLGITPIQGYNFAASTIIITGVSYLVAILRYRLFSFVPIARSRVMENISDLVVVIDTHGQLVDCNPPALHFIGLGSASFAGTPLELLPPFWQEVIQRGVRDGEGKREVTLPTKEGNRTFDLTVRTLRDGRDKTLGYLFLFHDITELRASEQKVARLLEEKNLLLQEVHHRIKNNMSVIASILSLQAETVQEKGARQALLEARGRVQSMMHLYERLYRSTSFDNVSVYDYLSPLIDKLVQSFNKSSRIVIEKIIAPVQISARFLFYIGIIVNELVTNALKYAFPNDETGKILIKCTLEDNMLDILVEDTGATFPSNVEEVLTTGFGLQVVRLMARQMGCQFSVERSAEYTRCRVTGLLGVVSE
ncbi:MAG: histidine kinase N-terminal 7TM domain-containing protein [Breznakiellaceae bacterium]